VDKFNADRIYAGSSSASLNGFFISTDGGATFGSSTISLNIWQILQTNSNELYIVTTSSPYPFNESTDGGLTWTAVGNLPAAMRGASLDLIEDIYTAGNTGVYKSTNGGSTFINHNFTFSSNKILTYDYKTMVCVTGASNGGVWIYTDSSLIPVELSSFTAVAENGNVLLSWTTATELNNSGFEIEKSDFTNSQWQKTGFVPGFGTVSEPHFYSFIDDNVENGNYYYRLKQIDFDGSFTYSEIINVEIQAPIEFALDQNFPNPFNPSTKIRFTIPIVIATPLGRGKQSQMVTLKVYDVLGNEVATLVNGDFILGEYEVNFSAMGRTSGIYFYKLEAGGFTQTKKMILIK
jgi:hypothetical protein